NDQLVVPQDALDPTPERPLFKARLLLPRVSNTIEVRYQWGDDRLRPFAVANAARLVQDVPAPRVELAALPSQTNKTILEIRGSVPPYFERLEVRLSHEPVGRYRLPLRPSKAG